MSDDKNKKPLDLAFDEKTAIMPSGDAPLTIKLSVDDDDGIDENFSFDQATVVQSASAPKVTAPVKQTAAKSTPPPLAVPAPAMTPPVAAAPAPTPKNPFVPPSAPPQQVLREKTGAVKITPPVAEIPPGEELEFEKKKRQKALAKKATGVEAFLQNKRAVGATAAFIALAIVFGIWKSNQPRKLDLHIDESSLSQKAPVENATPSTNESLSAEQVADRFESAFQKVQADSGHVSR